MKTALKILGALFLMLVLAGGGFYVWASMRVSGLMSRTVETHAVDFPVPWPLTAAEIEALPAPDSAEQVALVRAVERGRHLITSRYACTECHGANLGGGVMVDDPVLGTMLGPNITTGSGSAVSAYEPRDWDRTVRHGVGPSGNPLAMPAQDFQLMSDQELSDVVAYVRSLPPVDSDPIVSVDLGPLGNVLVALGQIPLAADMIPTHTERHAEVPPPSEVTVELGRHIAGVCTGCHRADLSGGPIMGGDPAWPPARNLTQHESALGTWTYEDFVRALREGRRPDGSELLSPMREATNYATNMTETELQALWAYLESLPAIAPVE